MAVMIERNVSSREARSRIPAIVLGATGVSLLVIGLAIAQQTAEEEYRDPTAYPAYFESGPDLPGYRFVELWIDPESPFYPSSATTRSGDFYSQAQLMDVERCGDAGCHPDIYDMWFESTHHLASMSDPWYRRTVQFIQERAGIATSRWCAGCHDPALMMTGVMQREEPIDMGSAASNIGISCQFCHSVDRIHPARANGSYRLAPAAALPYAGTDDPELRRLGNAELLADPELIQKHKSRRRSAFHSLSEFCATCHKQSLITPVNNYKWFRGFDEYDGWQDSGVSGNIARAFYYPESPKRCQDCHMPEVASTDAGNDDGMVNSHRFVGSNTALAAFHGYDEQLRQTVEFLQARQVTVDIFAVRVRDAAGESHLVAPADSAPLTVRAGDTLDVDVVVRTRGLGHQFTGGTTDSNLSWLEIALLDGDGDILLMSGGMDADEQVDRSAHAYRGIFLDEAGQELSKRNGWDRRTPVYVNSIPPGAADTVHYRFTVPEATGQLRLRARLNYRKHKQDYHRWALGAVPSATQPEGAVSTPAVDTRVWDYDDSLVPPLPVVLMDQTEVPLTVVDTAPLVSGGVDASPEQWMRFNDWGIGLLRQQDLRGALAAFASVREARPDYADALVNEARVHLLEGNLDDAEAALQQALAMQPEWFKAEYFLAQVSRSRGDYDQAARLLERVLVTYPYDRVARLDLGRVYYLMGRYPEAVEQLIFVIDMIDPEELGAHYNLMLSYRAMGQADKAKIHEARYLRYKDDEDIRQLTGAFKRADADANNEAQRIHRHTLRPPGGMASAPDMFPWQEWLRGGRYGRDPVSYPGPTPPWLRTDRPVAAAAQR